MNDGYTKCNAICEHCLGCLQCGAQGRLFTIGCTGCIECEGKNKIITGVKK